jgi:hypothetical protein
MTQMHTCYGRLYVCPCRSREGTVTSTQSKPSLFCSPGAACCVTLDCVSLFFHSLPTWRRGTCAMDFFFFFAVCKIFCVVSHSSLCDGIVLLYCTINTQCVPLDIRPFCFFPLSCTWTDIVINCVY